MKRYLLLLLIIGNNSNADLLKMDFSRKFNINGIPVATKVETGGTTLTLTGTGTAYKKVGLSKAKIFMMQYFSEFPEKLNREEPKALSSVKDIGQTAMHLTFMRNVDSVTIKESFNEYLINNMTPEELVSYKNDIQSVLNALGSDEVFVSGNAITIYSYKNVIQYENTKKVITTISSSNSDLTVKLFSMFIGKPTDSEGWSLKYQLLQNPKDVFGEKIFLME